MIYNVNVRKPDPSDVIVHHFESSSIVEEKESVVDSEGKKLRDRIVKKVRKVALPSDEFENKGMDCSMFSVENMKAAGVDLFQQSPTPVKLFGGDLDSIGAAKDSLDNFDYSQLTEQDFNE